MERAPTAHWIGGWVGPTAHLDAMEKNLLHCWESDHGCPVCRLSLYQLNYPSYYVTNLTYFNIRTSHHFKSDKDLTE
jgi:hypothetical protein